MAVLKTIGQVAGPNSVAEAYNGFGTFPVGTIMAWIPGLYANGSNGTYTVRLGGTDDATGANGYLNQFGWLVCNGAPLNDAISPIFAGSARYLPNLSGDRFLNGASACGTGQGGSNIMVEHSHAMSGTAAGQALGTTNRGISWSNTSVTDINAHNHLMANDGTPYLVIGGSNFNSSAGYSGANAGQASQAWGWLTGYQNGNTTHWHPATGTTDITHTHGSSSVTGTAGTGSVCASTENRPKYLKCFYIMRIK